jgi:hypothetical protein
VISRLTVSISNVNAAHPQQISQVRRITFVVLHPPDSGDPSAD